MTRALLRKALADLRGHRLQGLLIVVILAAATTTLFLAATVQRLTAAPFERLFREIHGAHVWFATTDAGVALAPIGDCDGVVATTGPHPVVNLLTDREMVGPDGSPTTMTTEIELVGLPAALQATGRPCGRPRRVRARPRARRRPLRVRRRAAPAAGPRGVGDRDPGQRVVGGIAVDPGRVGRVERGLARDRRRQTC